MFVHFIAWTAFFIVGVFVGSIMRATSHAFLGYSIWASFLWAVPTFYLAYLAKEQVYKKYSS